MPNTEQEARAACDSLESLVDRFSLATVLAMLAEVSDAKRDHLLSAWQDAPAAKEWERAAAAIERARVKVNALAL